MNEPYLLAVPSNTLVRDLDAVPPPYGGSGAPPKVPFQRADGRMKTAGIGLASKFVPARRDR